MSATSSHFSPHGGGYSSDFSSDYYRMDPVENECLEHYENNLEKYKDEHDAIQKKTFTKWVNKHLGKTGRQVNDLFLDLSDGLNLISLLEALSAEKLSREVGYTRFHRIQNVQYCLDFLRRKNIKTVNIRPEDIVEGNSKLTLGLIWTIILNFQVSVIKQRQLESSPSCQVSDVLSSSDGVSPRDALLQWAQEVTRGYPGVNIRNFTSSWRDGLAFNAILHRYRPNLIQWSRICRPDVSQRERLENAFTAAETEFNVSRLLDPEDVDVDSPDEKSIITYVSSLYNALPHTNSFKRFEDEMEEYEKQASEWLHWIEQATRLMNNRQIPSNAHELRRLLDELERFRTEDLPPKAREKKRLMDWYSELYSLFEETDLLRISPELSSQSLSNAWQRLEKAMEERVLVLQDRNGVNQGTLDDIVSRLTRGINITNEKLDHILNRIDNVDKRVENGWIADLQVLVDGIIDDLNVLESPIRGFFEDVEQLNQSRHPEASDLSKQVYGLEQRRRAYLGKLQTQFLSRLGLHSETLIRETEEKRETIRRSTFERVDECIEWIRQRIDKLSTMEFTENLDELEKMFEDHKIDNHNIQEFRQNVDECIAHQAEVPTEYTHDYCELLSTLESDYQQLRDLSAGRMLDLDSLIAFVRGAQEELRWIGVREDLEVTRNWSDINRLDLPMLRNYYKQILQEIELREPSFNDVHNKGAALLNQGHPAIRVIEFYLSTMQQKWDWLLGLTKCFEQHLKDALSLSTFMEDAKAADDAMIKQIELLERKYDRHDFTVEEGERLLHELDDINDLIRKYHNILMTLTDRSAQISPLWQRGERIQRPIPVTVITDYTDRNTSLRERDECTLLDNSDLIHWDIRGPDGNEHSVTSVLFRIPPPDSRLTAYLRTMHTTFDKLKRLWEKKHLLVRFNMVLNTMAQIRGWDLDTFMSLEPDVREQIIKALNDDSQKLLAELDSDDPLALRLKEELRLTNEHYYNLLNQSMRPQEPDLGSIFDEKIDGLLRNLEAAYNNLNDRASQGVPRTVNELEKLIAEHKNFEDKLQTYDVEVSNVKELFRQLPNPTPSQRANHDLLNNRWSDLWQLSQMYVERLKVLERVLQGILEVSDMVRQHEITLNSFDDFPAALDKLRGVHSQLLELNMVLKQQQNVVDSLSHSIAVLRQHIARTRQTTAHPDVDRLEDDVQNLVVRWENVCSQVANRLRTAEEALQIQMVYKSAYENEIAWLNRVESTINSLRRPEDMQPEQYQSQLDILLAEYAQLQERTEAIENVNKEGGKFIRQAKGYDTDLMQYMDDIVGVHGDSIRSLFRRTKPQPKNGAQIVTEELESLNRRLAQLSSFILEKRNYMQVLIQNWKRQKQDDVSNECERQQTNIMELLDMLNSVGSAVIDNAKTISSPKDAENLQKDIEALHLKLKTDATIIETSIKEADRLCAEEADMLTPDQFHGLKERRNQLESTYMRLLQHSDELLKKVNDITKFLLEFTSSASAFQSFITCKTREIGVIKAESGDLDKISVSMRRAEVLEDDVLRSKEQLEAIMNLLRQVRKALDDYAVELHIPYPNVKITTLDAPELGETLNTLQMDYGVLVEECSNLKEFLERLLSLSSHHNKNITTFEEEMVQLEAQINEAFEKVTKDDVISDAASASALLTELENLQTFSLEQDNRFDEIKKHADKLEEALTGTDAQKRIALESKQVLEDFKRRQNRARESIDGSVDSWRSKMAKSEGLREGVKDLLEWLSREQERLKSAPQLPLILSQLTEIKNEGEFAHKEIISRQKVLNSFEKEIFRNGDVKSAEVKNPELVAQYRKAESMFQPLISVSKAYCENVAELCTLLSSLNDGRKLLNDKIDIVEKKIGGISPLNQSDMESISSTLNELIAEDLQKLKDLENRIIEMPNTVEIDDVVTPMLNIEERINNLCKKLSSLKDRSENLLELKATYEEKKKNLDNKLCSLKAKLDDLDKIPLQEQQIVAQRMICEEVQNDYRSLQCDLDSFCKIGSDLIQLETITRAYGAGATDSEDQGYRLREVSSVAQRYDALAGQLKHKTEQIGLINEKLCDLYTTKNKLMQWTVQQCCMLEAECPAALTESDIAKNLSKVAKIEKTMEKDMLPSLQELRTKVKSLLNDASTTGGTDVLEAQKEVEKAWEKLQQTIGLIKHHSDVSRRLLEDAEDMDKWLKQKVRMLNVMEETINVDPKVINGQLVQVELLSSEMTDQESNRNKLNDLANELINNSDGVNRQQIIEKMDELNRKWVTFSNKLKSDAAKLSDVKESITRFSALQRSIKSTLLELAENVEEISRCPLTDSEVFEEHLNKLCQLQEKSSSVKEKVEELRSLGDFIALCLPSVENDVSEQLHASAKYAEELDKRIESLKNASLNAKKMESETTKEVESTFKWLKGVKGQLNDIGNVSADPRVLAEQTKNIGELYTDVLGREGDIALLRAKLNEQLKKSANPGLKTLYDNLYAEWIPVLEETKKKHATVEKVSALVKQLENMLDTFDQQTAVAQNNLKELSLGKMSDVKEMERQVELSMVELNSFEPLMSKLEKAVGGKSTSTLRRRLDNAQNDWAVLAKDVRNLVAKQQNKNELQNHFDKCKLETTALLNSAHEVIAPLDGKVGMESSIISVLPDKSAIEKVISDLKTGWIRQSNEMKCTAGEMQNVIDADEAAALRSNIDELESSYKELLDKLENKLDELIHKEEQADQLNYQVLEIGKDVQKIGSVMLYPIDVQTDHLKQEQSKCDELLQEINDKEKALNDLTNQLKSDCESGIITSSQLDGSLNQLIKTKEELASHKRRISQRKDKVSELLSSVENLQSEVGDICRELEDMSQCDILQKPIKPDLANLKGHQEEIRSFKDKLRKEIGGRVEKSIGDCDKLLKSADKQANVSEIDFIKSKLVQSWNDVCGCVSEHEKQVCSSIQELGTYADAYKALLAWLEDTEEALDNQQPPSTEYKVVKAQSAANDILLKHIEEKQPSVEKLKALMGKVVPVSGGDSQYITVKDSSEDFAKRYSQLLERAHTSRTQLHEALELAEKWSHLAAPLLLWLDATEKSVQQLGKVPVNKEVMQQQIDAHQTLQENIELKQREFDQLTAFCPRLAGLTSEKEAEELEEHMNGLLCRYQDLRDRTNQCGLLLKQLDEDIGCFLDETNALAEWLDKMENEIDKIQDISIHPDELIEQSSTLTELAMEVTDEEALVANVVENGRDLCRHTSGDEAIVLQTRIEGLRNRYLQLAAVTDSKIALLSEALPLAERFEDGYTNLQQWMDAVDQDLQDIDQVPLEAQSTLVNQMEEDLNKWRSDVDEVNNISKQLIHLSEGQTADELESRTDDLNRRFNVLADQVTRKAEKLALAEKQSRQVLDELDYLNGWFSDALERLKQASAPAVDPDYVKKQLKNQKLMNDDIAVMRSRLRDATADAQKVARALGDEADGQNALVASKIEAGRELSTEVAELGEKRLEELGQALALCQEVEQSFGELHTWLENIEAQIESTSKLNTGIQRHELLEQQAINAELEESIQSQKPLLDRFERNATALGELCDDEDTAQLYKIAEGLQERYEEVKNAVKNRALALDSAIEHSSQFTDRLDVILSKLGGAAAQIRNPDPVSADPERIRSQISDNMALKEELKLKEGALQSVKESADVILKQAKSNDPAVTEINAKIEKLDALWQELNNGVAARGNELENTLAKTERFWSDLEKCQNAIEELRVKITDIQPAAGQPAVIKEQQNTLLAIEGDIHETEPMVNELRLAGMDLCSSVASDERTHVEQQIGVVESNWATVTDLYALKNKDLIDAMENAMEFHGLYSELLNWMLEREEKMAEFSRMPGPSSTDVKNELAALDEMKTVLDEKVVQKERLNQLCANLCVGATVQQCAAIRAPLNDLNNRWNKLYVTLNERQQKVERALLEMGQFSQAYDQLMGWIEKTSHTLEEIDSAPANLKQVEIEVCKYKVVQNDIRAHETSVETLNSAAKRIINADPNSTSATQPMIDELNSQWHMLVDKLDNLWTQLTGAREAAESLGGEMDKWALWLQDKDADLSHSKPFAGLPETARAQLDDFFVLKAEIEQNKPELEAHLEAGAKYLSSNAENKDSWVAQKQQQLRRKWIQIQEKLCDKEQKLRIALADAEQLSAALNAMNDWLSNAETRLGILEPVSRIPENLERQIAEQKSFETEVAEQRDLMADLKSKGTKLQYLCEKKDAIPIKNNLVSARHRLDKITSRCADRGKQLESCYKDSTLYFDSCVDLMEWLNTSLKWIEDRNAEALFGENIREALDQHKNFQRELGTKQPLFDTTYKRGKSLSDHAPKAEQATFDDMNETLREHWSQLCNASIQRQRNIEETLLESGQFDDALSSLREWLEKTLPEVEVKSGESAYGDMETVNLFAEENQAFKDELASRQGSLDSVRRRAEQILNARKECDSSEGLRNNLNQLNNDWEKLESLVSKRQDNISEALEKATVFGDEARSILDWLPRIEDRLRMKGQKAETETEILDHMDEVAQIRKELDDASPRLEKVLNLGREILSKCHTNAEQNMKYWLKVLQTRWDEVSQITDSKRIELEKQLTDLHEQEELISKLLKFINAKDADLKVLSSNELPYDMEEVEKLLIEHEEFDNSLREKQNEVSNATVGRRMPIVSPQSAQPAKHQKPLLKKEKPVRHPKADLLSQKWNRLWLDSVEYGSRLRKMKEHLEELKKLESFTFDEWRERYLEWTDFGKARISDLFRRIDKSGTGSVPRNAFIEEILRSRFPTTQLEMEKVADEFDKGDGLIDSKEFMARLRSEFAKKLPMKQKTEGEKINEEVQRQSEKCSCHTPYRIQKVSEGHYRFGDTQIKRMVRILRFTVMVRVGGGWVALDEFLHKHDPCRAKGRTNIDLQRGFYNDVRPINAHDSMKMFTKSRSASNRASPVTVGSDIGQYSRYATTPGPITKIREKTERSVPMHIEKHTPSSSQVSLNEGSFLPRRTSDVSMQDGKIRRSSISSNISRSNSRGEIYDMLRPSSRCSESSDLFERPTRIPSLRGKKGVNYRPSSARNSPHC